MLYLRILRIHFLEGQGQIEIEMPSGRVEGTAVRSSRRAQEGASELRTLPERKPTVGN